MKPKEGTNAMPAIEGFVKNMDRLISIIGTLRSHDTIEYYDKQTGIVILYSPYFEDVVHLSADEREEYITNNIFDLNVELDVSGDRKRIVNLNGSGYLCDELHDEFLKHVMKQCRIKQFNAIEKNFFMNGWYLDYDEDDIYISKEEELWKVNISSMTYERVIADETEKEYIAYLERKGYTITKQP